MLKFAWWEKIIMIENLEIVKEDTFMGSFGDFWGYNALYSTGLSENISPPSSWPKNKQRKRS
jgi:hypothetical protein